MQCYTISYQSVSTRCETLKTTSKHECVTVSNLASKTVYTFKVRAESTAGPGPESELSDPIETMALSLDKPQVSNITHNSVKLSWKKPSECTVLYCIVYDHCKLSGRWQKEIAHTTSQDYFVCSNLVPKTEYRFKVRAETVTGSSLESELSDIIETLLPSPGKPYASKKTHNSIKLCWGKPEHAWL